MQGEGVLLTIAEVAIAFAGFSGVVVVLGRRDIPWTAAHLATFWEMIASSLSLLILALLPFVFHYADLSESTVWALSSAMAALGLLARGVFAGPRAVRLGAFRGIRRSGSAFALFGVPIVIALALNTFGLGLDREFFPFLAALIFYLVIACFTFWTLLKSRIPHADEGDLEG